MVLTESQSFSGKNGLIIKDLVIDGVDGNDDNSKNAINVWNCENVQIINCKITNCKGRAINLYKSKNVKIINCYGENVGLKFVYGQSCTDVSITYCTAKNMTGVAGEKASFIQLNTCTGKLYIAKNVTINEPGKSSLEDVISLYRCKGTQSVPAIAEFNYVKGGGPSVTGSGIMVGDKGGEWCIARKNIVIDGGASGMVSSSGDYNTISDNQIYHSSSNDSVCKVGIQAFNWYWNQGIPLSTNITVKNNVIGGFPKMFYLGTDGQNAVQKETLVMEGNKSDIYRDIPLPSEWGYKGSSFVEPDPIPVPTPADEVFSFTQGGLKISGTYGLNGNIKRVNKIEVTL